MTITYYGELIQGSEEWISQRCGLLTASEMSKIITPTLKIASNDKERSHLYELLSQRITKYVEPSYISDDMLRGIEDEVYAKMIYVEHYADIEDCGFITNDEWGFTIGYSPDGLVGDDGLVEFKSRRAKYQIESILECVPTDIIPAEFMLQCQTGLLVSRRKWLDFGTYCGGLPMATIRVWPDDKVQGAIVEAAEAFEARLAIKLAQYREILASRARLVPTERRIEQEITL